MKKINDSGKTDRKKIDSLLSDYSKTVSATSSLENKKAKQLIGLALTAGITGAMAPPAFSAIQYGTVNKTISCAFNTFTPSYSSYQYNSQTSVDFGAGNGKLSFYASLNNSFTVANPQTTNQNKIKMFLVDSTQAIMFNEGATISDSAGNTYAAAAYPINQNGTKYLGLRFNANDLDPSNDIYGWLKLQLLPPNQLKIIDWAYEDSGAPIKAGELPPQISIENSTLSYTEGNPAIPIDHTATASDPNADWNTGTLKVQITANPEADDEISIPDTAAGINTIGTELFDNTTKIGDLSIAKGTITNNSELIITFNANATNAHVAKVVRAIHYRNTSDNPGTLDRTIRFTLTDSEANQAEDTRTIAISLVNNAPVPDAGADQEVTGGDIVQLDASGSTDIDGTIESYLWELDGVDGFPSNLQNPSFTAPQSDTETILSVKLTITDNGGLTSVDSVNITVKPTTADTGNALIGGSSSGCFIGSASK